MTVPAPQFRRALRQRILAAGVLLWFLPSLVSGAGSVTQVLTVRDTKVVTRGEFIKAAVSAMTTNLVEGRVPYAGVSDALKPYVYIAERERALAVFGSAGADLRLRQGIRRGEAVTFLADLLHILPSKEALALAKAYTDLQTEKQRTGGVAAALEENWMKGQSTTVFGYQAALRGKEAKLLLGRAFALTVKPEGRDGPSETITIPIIRINVRGMERQAISKQELLEQVWNTLRREYLYQDKIDPDAASDKAVEGLVNSLNDPYTVYLPKTKNENFKLQMKGEVEGIGATVEMTGGVLTVVSPIRSSPAEKAGIKPKDQILSVNGESLKGLTLEEAVAKVRGPRGSTAVLRVRREGVEFDVSVMREKVRIPEVEITYDRNVAVVRIVQFWDTTDTKFRDAMKEVQTRNIRGVILDLRNNPGGLLHAAGVVMSNFLPKGSTYATIKERDITRTEVTEDEPTIKDSVPVIVLVNKGSASASEIVTGALQDAGRAKVVGETTYGKGTVQQVMQFSDGSSLKFTIAEWHTPKGRKIDKVGVEPDVTVVNNNGKDLQMEKAMELLR